MIACIFWCAIVTISFWTALTVKNRRKENATNKLGTSSSHGGQSTVNTGTITTSTETAAETGTKSGRKSGSKSGSGTNTIEKKSQDMIKKAVMRIAFYPVVPLVTALPLALGLSNKAIAMIYQFGWFSSIMSNLQVKIKD